MRTSILSVLFCGCLSSLIGCAAQIDPNDPTAANPITGATTGKQDGVLDAGVHEIADLAHTVVPHDMSHPKAASPPPTSSSNVPGTGTLLYDAAKDVWNWVSGSSGTRDTTSKKTSTTACGTVTTKGTCSSDKKTITYCDDNKTKSTISCDTSSPCSTTCAGNSGTAVCCATGSSQICTQAQVDNNACKDSGHLIECWNVGDPIGVIACDSGTICKADSDGFYACVSSKAGDKCTQAQVDYSDCRDNGATSVYCDAVGDAPELTTCDSGQLCGKDDDGYFYCGGASSAAAGSCTDDQVEFGGCSADGQSSLSCDQAGATPTVTACSDGQSCQQDTDGTYSCLDDGSNTPATNCNPGEDLGCDGNSWTYCGADGTVQYDADCGEDSCQDSCADGSHCC